MRDERNARMRTYVCRSSDCVELAEGDVITVGRGAACDIVLDDHLVSRTHLTLRLTNGRLVLHDQGSRNGALVNDLPAETRMQLHHGDCITVGRARLTVVQVRRRRSESAVMAKVATSEMDDTQNIQPLEMLLLSVRTALQDGDLDRAVRAGRALLMTARGAVSRGAPEEAWSGAVDVALDLAEATEEGTWLDRALGLCVAANRPLCASHSKRLERLASRYPLSIDSLDRYLDVVRASGSVQDPDKLAELSERMAS